MLPKLLNNLANCPPNLNWRSRSPAGRCGDPLAGATLGFGDFAGGHLFGDVGAAGLGLFMASHAGEVEPLMRFDEVARDAMAAGRIEYAKVETSIGIALHGHGQM